MGYYVDIFYDRKNPKKEYKIPFASDKGINKCSTGSATLKNAHDDVLHQDFYTIVSTYGIEAQPQGMPLKDFLKPFGGIDYFIDKYEKLPSPTDTYSEIFELKGLDGGTYKGHKTPFIQITVNYDYIESGTTISLQMYIDFYALGGTIRMRYKISPFYFFYGDVIDGKGPNTDWSTLLDTYILYRNSIVEYMNKHINTDYIGAIEHGNSYGYIVYESKYVGHEYDIRGEGEYIMGECLEWYSVYDAYNQNDVTKFEKNVPHDTIENEPDSGTQDRSGGDDGTGTGKPPTGDNIALPDIPSKNIVGTGLLHAYVLSNEQISAFSEWLWQDNIMEYLSKLFSSNPLESIISTSLMPYTPNTSGTSAIKLGSQVCGTVTNALQVTSQFQKFDFTYSGLSAHMWGNALDYSQGTTIYLYVPFVGLVPLDTNKAVFTKLTLRYIIDNITGQGVVSLLSEKNNANFDSGRNAIVLDSWSFNCKSTIALTRQDMSSIISSAMSGITSLMSGNVLGVANSIMNSRPNSERNGTFNTSSAYMGMRRPYIVYSFSNVVIPSGGYGYIGRPQYSVKKVSTCSGFIKCKSHNITFTNTPTENEKTEIYNMLEQGVIV